MPDISIQFHGTIEEAVSLLDKFAKSTAFYATAVRFPPFSAETVKHELLANVVGERNVQTLVLTLQPAALPAATMGVLLDNNPGALLLDLGRLTKAGLEESCLAARALTPKQAEAWRPLVRSLKAHTKAGAVAHNPDTGASVHLRAHRYTEGAMRLNNSGVRMVAAGGGNSLTFQAAS